MVDIKSPFAVLPPEIAFNFGITLIAISISIIVTYSLELDITSTQKQQFIFSSAIGILVFVSVNSSPLIQQISGYLTLVMVILFPVIVGYLGFQELVLKGVFYGP